MAKDIRWLTTADAADMACCDLKAIRRAVRNGRLRAVRVAHGRLKFLERWIDEWLIDQLVPEDHEVACCVDAAPSSPQELSWR